MLTVTPTKPPELWIELKEGAVALFRYPARCLTHKCLGEPYMGPLYMALHTLHVQPSVLRLALQTYPAQEFWGQRTPTGTPRQRSSIYSPGWSRVYGSINGRHW